MATALPDITTLSALGGPLNNYAPVEDPTVDEDAANINVVKCNVAMSSHTVMRAFVSFVTAGASTPTDPASNVHDALWGNAIAVKPTLAHSATGVLTATWPTDVSDEGTVLGQTAATHTLAFRHAWVVVEGSTYVRVQAKVTAPNVVTIYTFDAAGAALDTTGAQICVFVV